MFESTGAAAPIPCRVGPFESGYYIESPRTGKRLSFTRELQKPLPRIWGRIVQKTSQGQLVVPFTSDELMAVKLLLEAVTEYQARKNDNPARHFGMYANGNSEYGYWTFQNRGKREEMYALRPDDTFEVEVSTTFVDGLWWRHPRGAAQSVAGAEKEALPIGIVEKFNNCKSAVFTGAEMNTLYAAHSAMHRRRGPARPRRRYR